MIYRARTMNLLAGKADAVRAVSLRAAAYVNAHYPGIHVEILENIAGVRDQIHVVDNLYHVLPTNAHVEP